MIVRTDGDALTLVTQPDHARLAHDILLGWQADGFPERGSRDVILLAAAEHDNGWLEPDAEPLVDPGTGLPYDFLDMPDPVKQGVWPRGIARLARVSTGAAALVAEHALTIYARYQGHADWQSFFDTLRSAQTELLRGDPAAERGLPEDYRFLYLGDLLSLIFCNGWTQTFEADGRRITLVGDELQVAPDPFGGAAVPLRVRSRRIAARRYASDAELRGAIAAALDVTIAGVAIGRSENPR
jgi:hypothetical protein